MHSSLEDLNKTIIDCRKCPRLVEFRERVAREKRKQFSEFEYWGRPITGYGDPGARLAVLGLAPAAHGGNRTGRVFTGDNSAKFLVRHLHKFGFANQSTSETRGDGLEYRDCYVTAIVRCVPPHDKPTLIEIASCSNYLEEEFKLLPRLEIILALGKVAFDSYVRVVKRNYNVKGKFAFEHGMKYSFSKELPTVFASYHPSPRNTNTGRLTSAMFSSVLRRISKTLDQGVKQ